jgi:hypothetical protein
VYDFSLIIGNKDSSVERWVFGTKDDHRLEACPFRIIFQINLLYFKFKFSVLSKPNLGPQKSDSIAPP